MPPPGSAVGCCGCIAGKICRAGSTQWDVLVWAVGRGLCVTASVGISSQPPREQSAFLLMPRPARWVDATDRTADRRAALETGSLDVRLNSLSYSACDAFCNDRYHLVKPNF